VRLASRSVPVRRRKLYEEVASRIEDMIHADGYEADQPIPAEREIMEQFGVGRSTVREAMMSLERMGLVTIRSGERARVAKPTAGVLIRELAGAARLLLAQDKGIEQFQDARLLLEVGTARLAALRASSSDFLCSRQPWTPTAAPSGIRPNSCARTWLFTMQSRPQQGIRSSRHSTTGWWNGLSISGKPLCGPQILHGTPTPHTSGSIAPSKGATRPKPRPRCRSISLRS